MEISKTEIGNALTSADDNHILATANDIYDEEQQAYQSEINQSLKEGKQDKLVSGTNIKTINGISLLGSGDVVVSGDASGSVDEGRLVWSDEDSPSTLMDIAYLNSNGNKIAGIPPSLVTIEYSADNGATWRDSGFSDASKIRLTNHRINGFAYVFPNGSTTLDINYQTRITFDLIEDSATNAWVGCFGFRKIILKCSGIQRNDTHTMTVEMQKYGSTTWDIIKVSRFWGSPGFFSISTPKRIVGYPSASYYRKVRLTWQTGDVYTNIAYISGIFFMSDNIVGAGRGKEPSQYAITGTPYSVDYNQNVTFPNAIKGKKLITDGGTNQQAVLGDGNLIPLSELSPITDADAEILLDNHIHSIDVNANGNNVNISVIESSKNGNNWETEEKNIPLPVASQDTAGIISAADKNKIDNINYEDNTLFVGDGMDGTLAIGHESSKTSAVMRVFHDRMATIHTISYDDTTGVSIAVMEAIGGVGRMEANGDRLAELALSGAGKVRATLTKENEDGTRVKTIIDAEEGITAPKLATIGGTSEQILLGDGTLITFDELKAKLGLI